MPSIIYCSQYRTQTRLSYDQNSYGHNFYGQNSYDKKSYKIKTPVLKTRNDLFIEIGEFFSLFNKMT